MESTIINVLEVPVATPAAPATKKTFHNFLVDIKNLEWDKDTDTYTGISMGKKFSCISCLKFSWGQKKSSDRQSGSGKNIKLRRSIGFDSPKSNTTSSVVIETVYAYLRHMYNTGIIPWGMIGNVKNNNGAQLIVTDYIIAGDNIELIPDGKNQKHGAIWKRIFEACGIHAWFSALDKDFIKYIDSIPKKVKITEEILDAYKGEHEFQTDINGIKYFRVF